MRTRVVLIAVLASGLSQVGVQAAPVTLRVEVEPPSQGGGPIHWGLLINQLEVAAGQGALDGQPLRIEKAFETDQPASQALVMVSLQADDALRSYAPSFGDRYQAASVTASDGLWTARVSADGWRKVEPTAVGQVLTVHYHRFGGDYRDVSLWTWDEPLKRAPKENELRPVGRDEFGVIFQVDAGLYGKPGERIGLLPRRNFDWQHKDDGDRFWNPVDGRDVWLVEGRGEAFASRPDVAAMADERRRTAAVQDALLGPPYTDQTTQLGAVHTPERTSFGVFAPTARKAWVVIADGPQGDVGRREVELKENGRGIWTAAADSDLAGKWYAWRIEGPGLDAKAEITDPYAVCTDTRSARSRIVNLRATDPPGFERRGGSRAEHPIICELHIRDYTVAASSGAKAKGTYLGLAEPDTRGPGGLPSGLAHLRHMGFTHVQFMPVQDFANDESRPDEYNWGYMPVHFNSPDGVYASRPGGPEKIREFKQLVAAVHQAGMGVIMDVVYNHTADKAPFERLIPGYYHRRTPDGTFSNGSGCGNEFRSEAPMGRRFIIDSLKLWVSEYGVDGFRFDLMGLIDEETLRQARRELDAIRPGILLYGEPWAAGATVLPQLSDRQRMRASEIGSFNDRFRDAIKGDRDGGGPGFIQAGERSADIRLGLGGSILDWAYSPADTINYFEAHDNLTAWDKLVQSTPNATREDRLAMLRLAHLVLLTSQGTVFMHAGQEFGRTKGGASNSYNLPDSVNQVDWSLCQANAELVEYVRGLIALRKRLEAFELDGRGMVEQRVRFRPSPNERCIAYEVTIGSEPSGLRQVAVLLNGSDAPAEFKLAEGRRFQVLVEAAQVAAPSTSLRTLTDRCTVPAHSGTLLLGE